MMRIRSAPRKTNDMSKPFDMNEALPTIGTIRAHMTWIALALAAGCGAQNNTSGNNRPADAPYYSPGSNGSNTVADARMASHDAPMGSHDGSAASACANGRAVYLAFEGVTLTYGPTDATANQAEWLGMPAATVPSYQPTLANRTMQLQSIVDGVKSRLSATPIQVVTSRPSAGPYVMIVLGGSGQDVGSPYSAESVHDCGDQVKSDVGWISDDISLSAVPNVIVGAIGFGLGLNGTTDPNDCMCGWSNNCASGSGACSLSTSIATSQASGTFCSHEDPQNEVAAFSTLFCQ
jgi:hypothetical protein